MKYSEFLKMVVDGGIEAARRDYAYDEFKRAGAVAGFEACRDKHPGDLALLLEQAHAATTAAHEAHAANRSAGGGIGAYWQARCYELEVEWTCNVIAATFGVVDLRRRIEVPSPFVEWKNPPVAFTARGALRAAAVLGVQV